MKHRFGIFLGLGLGLGLGIPLVIGGPHVFHLLLRVPPGTLALLLGMIFVCWNLNAARVRLLTGGTGVYLSHVSALAILIATEFAISITPAASGGPVTYAWLLHRQGLSRSRAVALYVADHFIDMLFFLSALCIVLLHWLLVPQELRFGWELAGLAVLLVGVMALLWLFVDQERYLFDITGSLLERLRVSVKRRRQLARLALEFRHGLRMVKAYSRARLGALFLLCTLHWLLRYSVLYIAVKTVGASISWSFAFIVQMLSMTAGQATLLPGGSGTAEASSALLLSSQMDASTAAAAILLWRFVTFHWYLIAGAPVFAALAGKPLWQLATKPGNVA